MLWEIYDFISTEIGKQPDDRNENSLKNIQGLPIVFRILEITWYGLSLPNHFLQFSS